MFFDQCFFSCSAIFERRGFVAMVSFDLPLKFAQGDLFVMVC